jgi:parvulin-like peptidyl-prolyl isomerase
VKHSGSANPEDQRFISVTRSQDEAKQKAEALRRVVADDPSRFSAIASEHSDLPHNNGGLLGWVAPEDLDVEFARIAWTLTANEISDVFETKIGYHVILRAQ